MSVKVTGALGYQAAAAATAGNFVVNSDDRGIVAIGGAVDVPGSNGGSANVAVSAKRVWILPVWTGRVSVSDPGAGVSVSAPIFGALTRNGSTVSGLSSWFRMSSSPTRIQPFNLSWSVTDHG